MTTLAIVYLALFAVLSGALAYGRGNIEGTAAGLGFFALILVGAALSVGALV